MPTCRFAGDWREGDTKAVAARAHLVAELRAFVTNGTDGYLFTTGGSGTTIRDAVELDGSVAITAQDIIGGPVAAAA